MNNLRKNKPSRGEKIFNFIQWMGRTKNDKKGRDGTDAKMKESDGEKALKELLKSTRGPSSQDHSQNWNVDDIKHCVTAKNLCSCSDPISMAFEVNRALQKLADSNTENAEFLKRLADQTEDFAVQLIDQVTSREELVIRDVPEHVDRYASMLSGLTDDAIIQSQKKFVAHPLLYKRLKMRWNLGLPDALKPHGKFRSLLFLLILIDTVLTPFLLPIIAYAFFRDQRKMRKALDTKDSNESRRLTDERLVQDKLDVYLSFFTTPLVIFVKDKLSRVVFIALHVRVCILASTVYPRLEEYLIFIFFAGLVVSEWQQFKASPLKYFKDMWNYLDVFTLLIYLLIVTMRIVTFARGGEPYHNRLLEIVNYFYGASTMLLVLRFSSVLELSSVVGPLQLALFRMLIDLLIFLVQFFFVILAFSLVITKCFMAEMSYMTLANNQTEDVAKYKPYCEEGAVQCLSKTSRQLMWSVFGLTNLEQMESHTSLTSDVVAVLYLIFLVLSVIMLVNMLVALLNNTYTNVTTNAEVEWKFSRAVVENQYRNHHSIVVPFNLLSVPLELLYFKNNGDSRQEDADNRRKEYRMYYRSSLFPTIIERYTNKYGGSFPLSIEEKIDLLIKDKLQISNVDESAPEKQDEHDFGVYKDRITDSTSAVVHSPKNKSSSNGAEAKPSSSDCHIELSFIA